MCAKRSQNVFTNYIYIYIYNNMNVYECIKRI